MPSASLTSLAVALLVALTPVRVTAAPLPGGGNRRTDCLP